MSPTTYHYDYQYQNNSYTYSHLKNYCLLVLP